MCGELGLSEPASRSVSTTKRTRTRTAKPLPAVTRKHYNKATRIRVAKKREVLDAWAAELRQIIGTPEESEQRLAA